MDFIEKCRQRFLQYHTVLCLGMDPILDKIPLHQHHPIEQIITDFYFSLMENFHTYLLAIKPNIAFYEQYGYEGLSALKIIIRQAKKMELPVILDAKRGDIGDTAAAYARAIFEELSADAVTLSPFLGEDSLVPFFQYKEKGFFILNRTSNPGGNDFQLLKLADGRYLYQELSEKIVSWNRTYSGNIGAVVGATHINEMKTIASLFAEYAGLPLLIPGVGKQGGDFTAVINLLQNLSYPLHQVFINSSSKINYAYLEHPGMDYLEATLFEIKKMKIN